MTSSLLFFHIFFATVLVTRIFLWFSPISSPTVFGFRLHHWMYGLALISVGIGFSFLPVYAIGLGLFVDELTYLFMDGKTHKDYDSKISLLGTVLLIVLVFMLKNYLVVTFL